MGIYRDKKDNCWYADFYYEGRRRRKKAGKSKKIAEKILSKIKTQIAENRYLDIKKEEKIKFEDFADEYFKIHSKQNLSWKSYDLCNIKSLKKYFSGKYLHEITPLMVEKFKMERAQEVSHATVNRNLACLKSMFNRAIEWGKITENPVRKVKLFREDNKRLRYLEKEEIVRLLSNCNEYLKPIVTIALNTGMRRAGIFNLKWQNTDFNHEIIYILNSKNGEKREIPMNKQVKTTLIKVKKHPDSPYIFCHQDGTPYKNLRKSFFTALKESGIINFRFHDLRHTFASQLVMSGVDLNTVRELLGHKSIEMTLRYAHLSPNYKKKAVETLDRILMDSYMDSKEDFHRKSEKGSFDNLLINKELVHSGP